MLNAFENIPSFNLTTVQMTIGNFYIDMIELNDFISMKTLALLITGQVSNTVTATAGQTVSLTAGNTLSASFGLYSMTGGTLTLVNSGSSSFFTSASTTANTTSGTRTRTANANYLSWLTLATSATSLLTPGEWFFGYLFSTTQAGTSTSAGGSLTTNGSNTLAYYAGAGVSLTNTTQYGGGVYVGSLSVTTLSIPVSIATTDVVKFESAANNCYILIST